MFRHGKRPGLAGRDGARKTVVYETSGDSQRSMVLHAATCRNIPVSSRDQRICSPAGLSTRGKTARRPSKGAASFVQRLVDGCSDGRARDQTWPWVLRQRLGNQVHIGLAISGDTRRYTPPMCGLEWSGKPVGPRQYETCLPLWSESVCLPGRQSTVWYSRRRSRRFDRVCSLVPSSCSYS